MRRSPFSPYSPVFFSPVFLCLPSEADASIFSYNSRVSLFLAEVTQVKGFLLIPYSRSGYFRLIDPLHEVVQCQSSPAS